jgi:hypothetical protein
MPDRCWTITLLAGGAHRLMHLRWVNAVTLNPLDGSMWWCAWYNLEMSL